MVEISTAVTLPGADLPRAWLPAHGRRASGPEHDKAEASAAGVHPGSAQRARRLYHGVSGRAKAVHREERQAQLQGVQLLRRVHKAWRGGRRGVGACIGGASRSQLVPSHRRDDNACREVCRWYHARTWYVCVLEV